MRGDHRYSIPPTLHCIYLDRGNVDASGGWASSAARKEMGMVGGQVRSVHMGGTCGPWCHVEFVV